MENRISVIPAKAGIHLFRRFAATWIPAFAGMTGWGRYDGVMRGYDGAAHP